MVKRSDKILRLFPGTSGKFYLFLNNQSSFLFFFFLAPQMTVDQGNGKC